MRVSFKSKNATIDWLSLSWNLLFWKVLYEKILALLGLNSFVSAAHVIVFSFCFIVYFYNIFRGRIRVFLNISSLIPFIVILAFLLSYLFKPNDYLSKYFFDYIEYVFLAALIINSIDNGETFIKYYCIFSIVVFLSLGFIPIFDPTNMLRMSYGFNISIPCFIGFVFLRRKYKLRMFIVIELVTVILAFIYGNRSCLLTFAFCVVMYMLFLEENNKKRYIQILIGLGCVFLLYFNLDTIMNLFDKLLSALNYHSYSYMKFSSMLNGDYLETLSGRDVIYSQARSIINTNSIFGGGIGAFEQVTGYYVHNIFYDFILSFGFLGAIIIVSIFLYFIYFSFKETNEYNKSVFVILLSLWFPKLLLSSTYIYDIGFWCCLVFSLSCRWKTKHLLLR